MKSKTVSAFTLIELLVVVAILAVLAAIGSAALLSAADKGKTAAEVTAAKTLITAYQSAAADNGGRYLPARDTSATNVFNGEGKPIADRKLRARYPFRLAPYFNYAIDSTLLPGGNPSQILRAFPQLSSPSGYWYDYGISVFPSFGINRSFVGGSTGQTNSESIRSIAQATHSIITFVSAGTSEIDGYEYVLSPGEAEGWSGSDWTDDSDPGDFGFVHPRHGGKAIAAFLDGSIRLMTVSELRDMRLWSIRAAEQNNPGYTVNQ